MKTGIELIAEERENHTWAASHDDQHDIGQLCSAAGAYLFAGDCLANAAVMNPDYKCTPESLKQEIEDNEKLVHWPFEMEALKIEADPIRSLVKAGALIAAEIDRLNRRKLTAPHSHASPPEHSPHNS